MSTVVTEPHVPEETQTPSSGGIPRWLKSRRSGTVTFFVLIFAGWQIMVSLLDVHTLPTPVSVAAFMWDEIRGETLAPDNMYIAFLITFRRLGVGLVLAAAMGVPIGLLMGLSKRFEAMVRDFVVVLLTLPYIIWALVLSMWFGFTDTASVWTVALSAVPYVILNVWEGVKDVPRDLVEMSRAFEMPRGDLIRHVIMPSQMPFLFAAARYGFANGWKGVVVAEVFGAANGAGWTIRYWYDAHRAYGLVGYAVFFIVLSLVLERVVFGKLSDRVFRWRAAVSDEA